MGHTHTGIAISLMLPPADARELALTRPGAVPADELHLTLAYLGQVPDVQDGATMLLPMLSEALGRFAEQQPPALKGVINGQGVFATSSEDNPNVHQNALWLAWDCPELPAFRQSLIEFLEANGLATHWSSHHGFTPHITLAYLEANEPLPVVYTEALYKPLVFNSLTLMWAGGRRHFTLGQAQEKFMPPEQTELPAEKALALTEMHHAVYQAIETSLRGTSKEFMWVLVDVYPEFAVIGLNNTFFRVPYTVEGNSVVLPKRAEWVEVMREWVNIVPQESIVAVGDEIKALGDGRIGGYLVRFTDERSPDLQGDYFTKATDFGPHQQSLIFYHHGDDPQVGKRPLGVKMATLTPHDVGVWLDAQLEMRDEYERYIYRLVEMGKAGFSSGTAPHLVERQWTGKAHHITKWYLGLDASITPTPAAGPHLTQVLPLKSFTQAYPVTPLKALLEELGDSSTASDEAEAEPPVEEETPLPLDNPDLPSPTSEEFDMDEEKLKALLEGSIKAAIAPLQAEVATLKKALEDEPPINDPGPALPAGQGQPPAEEGMPYYLKYGTETAAKAQVLKELAGGNYELVNLRMTQALVKALRQPDSLSLEERKLLSNQIFAPTHIGLYLKEGASVRTIKDMQQVAQGQLGGYAMAPQMQENIVTALPGLVAMRKYGARVVTLLQGDTYTVNIYKNNSDQYLGTIRGQWGGEKNTATEQNFQTEEVDVKVNPYNYKISLTNSVLMFTANLVQLLEQDIIETMSMDEDNTFWTGDGVKKPLGWLPGGLNAHGLKEVLSGHASTLTTDGVIKLKRGVPSQYRERGIFIGNSDTYGTVETLTVSGTGSDKAFPALAETGQLLRRPAAEAGGLPDVAANAYPLLFGDPRGYTIVETPGFTLQRLQDTQTGLTKAEIHVLKYTGGRPVQMYYFAVQKVAA